MANHSVENSGVLQNDTEIEHAFSQCYNASLQESLEKPLSPILGNSSFPGHRKIIRGRRLLKKSSRVKLSDRFSASEQCSSNTTLFGQSFSKSLEEFEQNPSGKSQESNVSFGDSSQEIEENVPVKLLLRDKTIDNVSSNEFYFKKPVSPAPSKSRVKIYAKNTDFQTTTGKSIAISDIALKSSVGIFDDILNPSQSCGDVSRKNKLAFLSKNNSSQKNCKDSSKFSPTCVKNEDKEFSLTQEIADSGISNSQMCFALDNVLNCEKLPENKNCGFTKLEVEKSQHFCESVKNVCAVLEEKLLKLMVKNQAVSGAKNCNKKSIFSISNVDNLPQNESKKHKPSDLFLPPLKRLKSLSCEEVKDFCSFDNLEASSRFREKIIEKSISNSQKLVQNTITGEDFGTFANFAKKIEESVVTPRKFEGFFSASGKTIKVSSSALREAVKIFASTKIEVESDILNNTEKLFKTAPNPLEISSNFEGLSSAIRNSIIMKVAEKLPQNTETEKSVKSSCVTKDLEAQSNSDDILKGINALNELIEAKTSKGFIRASGKPITVSEQAMKKAEEIFQSTEIGEDLQGFPSVAETKKTFCKKATKSGEDFLFPKSSKTLSKSASFQGFSSASGKSISISEDALKTAEKIFAGTEIETEKGFLACNNSKTQKNVTVLDNAMKTAEKLIEGTENHEDFSIARNSKTPSSFQGFSCASGKAITVSEKAMKAAEKIFESTETEEDFSISKNVKSSNRGFSSASGKPITVSDKFVKLAEKTIRCSGNEQELVGFSKNLKPTTSFQGFSCASGKSIRVSEKALKAAEKIFQSTEIEEDIVTLKNATTGSEKEFFRASENNKTVEKDMPAEDCYKNRPTKHQNISKNVLNENYPNSVGKNIFTSQEALKTTENKGFEDFSEKKSDVGVVAPNIFIRSKSFQGFSSASGKSIQVSENALKKAETLFRDTQTEGESPSCKNIKSSFLEEDKMQLGLPGNLSDISTASTSTGKPSNNPGNILKDINLENAKETLTNFGAFSRKIQQNPQDLLTPTKLSNNSRSEHSSSSSIPSVKSNSCRKRLGVSSCKQIRIGENQLEKARYLFEDLHTASPIRRRENIPFTSTPIRQTSANSVKKKFETSTDSIITPIKGNVEDSSVSNASELFEDGTLVADSSIVVQQPQDLNCLFGGLEAEKQRLEEQVKVVLRRLEVLRQCRHNLEGNIVEERTRPRAGVLFEAKRNQRKCLIENYVKYKKPGSFPNCFPSGNVLEISPENAENVHFNFCSTGQFFATITTKDGAEIVPNAKNLVGLTELELAFKNMPGVEKKLIPKGWIRNHYKWIIWKLASYERTFPKEFEGSFCLENVLQQLKYRYDREIDRAERSALRKICEQDDSAQKRMVLCVSKIVKGAATGVNELELTDGWYAIRTVIDELLNTQITKGRIQVGCKLLICEAELLNCDGCHPLEITNLVSLRINFNCTRRAVWHAKLGFQRDCSPFPVSMKSVHPSGGAVGCVQFFIARVHPVRFMEKCNNFSVWRNQKAEERRAQEWDNERGKKLEEIQEMVQKEFEDKERKARLISSNKNYTISEISCPKTLLDIMESSNDPESFQEKLSSTQKSALQNYQEESNRQKMADIRAKIENFVEILNLKQRDVVAFLQILVVDVRSDLKCSFSVWRPNEAHEQLLKEGAVVSAYNVKPKLRGDFSSSFKTRFKLESSQCFSSKFFKYKRQFVPISLLETFVFDSGFEEFDTVGVVVQFKVEENYQEVFLADLPSKRLLLVKAFLGPKKCVLLDNLQRGQTVTVCNLIFRKFYPDYSKALANYQTIFSSYSQHKHLQEGKELFVQQLPKNVDTLLIDCDKKILNCRIGKNKSSSSDILNETVEENNTLVYSRITSTDIAMSLFDVDKFNL